MNFKTHLPPCTVQRCGPKLFFRLSFQPQNPPQVLARLPCQREEFNLRTTHALLCCSPSDAAAFRATHRVRGGCRHPLRARARSTWGCEHRSVGRGGLSACTSAALRGRGWFKLTPSEMLTPCKMACRPQHHVFVAFFLLLLFFLGFISFNSSIFPLIGATVFNPAPGATLPWLPAQASASEGYF